MVDQMTVSLQQNVLAVLLFEEKHALIIRNALSLDRWASDPSILALVTDVYNYIDNYGKPPKDHVFDIIDSLRLDHSEKQNLETLTQFCMTRSMGWNEEYIMDCVSQFHRQTMLKEANQRVASLIEQGKLVDAEQVMFCCMKKGLELFQPGSTLDDTIRRILTGERGESEADRVLLGIEPLDWRGIGPKRKQLFLIGAPPKGGKSWGLIHIGKRALMENKKVLHVTLELEEDLVNERYVQAIYSLSQRPIVNPRRQTFIREFDFDVSDPLYRPSLTDEAAQLEIASKLSKHKFIAENLRTKEFPMNSLTVREFESFLDGLTMQYNFDPDVVIFDYADLFKIDLTNYRHSLNNVYKDIRRVMVERNKIGATATQANRAGAANKRIEQTHVAESFDKVATVDNFITHSQTDQERLLGLARLYVAASRNSEQGFEVLISQNYSLGQFCLSAHDLTPDWKDRLDQLLKQVGATP